MSGKITYKIRIKKEYTRSDGTCALYLDIYQNRTKKKLNLNLSVPIEFFDDKKQRVKPSYKFANDYNLLIEKLLSDINSIEVNYRLNNDKLTIDKLLEDLTQPSLRINFNLFYDKLLEHQHDNKIIKHSTYKQQLATLGKLKRYKDPLVFADMDVEWLAKFKHWLKTSENNKPATVEGTIKNIKKYLKAANDKGIRTPLNYKDIKVKQVEGEITFLLSNEVKTLYNYYNSDFINPTWKAILQRYLFACFTGLRISDIHSITEDNFLDDTLVFNAKKTGKLQRLKLNKTALSLVELPHVFSGTYAEQTINKELKNIATAVGIKKRLYFHSSRHTFATNYLISGGQLQNLKKLLGHSKIDTTMIYSHVVDSLMNKEVGYLDDIVS